MTNYKFLNGNLSLPDLTLENGGVPIRSIVISTWRSGSSYFGQIISAMPQNFYFYEPLLPFGVKQMQAPTDDKIAVDYLRKLMNCDFNDVEPFMKLARKFHWFFASNLQLWSYCKEFPEYCYNPQFLHYFCKLFPLQSMKILRLRLKIAGNFLRDLRCATD